MNQPIGRVYHVIVGSERSSLISQLKDLPASLVFGFLEMQTRKNCEFAEKQFRRYIESGGTGFSE